MMRPVAVAFIVAGSCAASGPVRSQSLSQIFAAPALQSSLFGVSAVASTGLALASGGQLNLNTLNQAGSDQSPLIASGASFLLNQSVGTGATPSSILQSSVNEIQSVSTGLGAVALSTLTGPQAALNTVNSANLALSQGVSASFLQSMQPGAPSNLTSTNLLSATSAGGSAMLMGNGQFQTSGVTINSLVLSLAGPTRIVLGQSAPTGAVTIKSGNAAVASGQTGASIGVP